MSQGTIICECSEVSEIPLKPDGLPFKYRLNISQLSVLWFGSRHNRRHCSKDSLREFATAPVIFTVVIIGLIHGMQLTVISVGLAVTLGTFAGLN